MPLDTTALDPSSAPWTDAVWQFALYLFREAGSESVRTREALAAAVANRGRTRLSVGGERQAGSAARREREAVILRCVVELGMPEGGEPHLDDLLFASCHRIAKRAVNGALQDPTGGATRFHLLGHNPGWARGLTPCAWIGSYLFYLHEEGTRPDIGADLQPGDECGPDRNAAGSESRTER